MDQTQLAIAMTLKALKVLLCGYFYYVTLEHFT